MIPVTRAYLAVIAFVLSTSCAVAETRFVDDKLLIGLHAGSDPASTVVELLPSGTALDVLARDATMVQVRLPDGREGWVDGEFLVAEAPGRARQQTMQGEVDALKAELADVQAQLAETQSQLEQQSAEVPTATPDESIPSETLREMQTLVEENQQLKQSLEELKATERKARNRAERAERSLADNNGNRANANSTAHGFRFLHWERWQQILLASGLLLAFAAGGWVVDWSVRRRHGGFRI